MDDGNATDTPQLEKIYDEDQEIWKCSGCGDRVQRGCSEGLPASEGCSTGGGHVWTVAKMLDVYGRVIPGYGDEG